MAAVKKKPIKTSASSRHITNLKKSILETFDIYGLTQVAQQSLTKTISMSVVNFITPKAGTKCELLFNKLASAGLSNKSSCLAPALGFTKFIIFTDMILVTLCCDT
jgi:hypothetical protein